MPVSQHCLFEVLLAMLHSKPKVLIIMFLKSGWECIWGLGVYFLWGFLEQGLLGSWSICSEEFQHGSCPGDRKCITTIAQQGWISKNSNGLPSGLLVLKNFTKFLGHNLLNKKANPRAHVYSTGQAIPYWFMPSWCSWSHVLKDIIWALALCVGRGKLRIVQKWTRTNNVAQGYFVFALSSFGTKCFF